MSLFDSIATSTEKWKISMLDTLKKRLPMLSQVKSGWDLSFKLTVMDHSNCVPSFIFPSQNARFGSKIDLKPELLRVRSDVPLTKS